MLLEDVTCMYKYANCDTSKNTEDFKIKEPWVPLPKKDLNYSEYKKKQQQLINWPLWH